jgi:hypothetical protein
VVGIEIETQLKIVADCLTADFFPQCPDKSLAGSVAEAHNYFERCV